MPIPSFPRRGLLGGGCVAAGSLAAGFPRGLPAGGCFAGGSDRLRVGLIGCGGRGAGAAMQAVAADRGVRITALADLFTDQIDAAVDILGRTTGDAFDCPAARRFAGDDAWRRLLDMELDAVILATSPDGRPEQATAAVAAGRHVYCETPAAIDAAGVSAVLLACQAAESAALSFGSGLAWRHDPATIRAVARIREGGIGRPLVAVATSRIGPAWHKAHGPGQAVTAARNWIACGDRSGGDFVEHQVHAIDKMLWAFGDVPPAAAVPLEGAARPGLAAVRFEYADGRSIEAGIVRRAGGVDRIEELVRGTAGSCDLRTAGGGAGRHRLGMEAFVRSIRRGMPLAEGLSLCRGTLTAILGREALAARTRLAWAELDRPAAPQSLRPVSPA